MKYCDIVLSEKWEIIGSTLYVFSSHSSLYSWSEGRKVRSYSEKKSFDSLDSRLCARLYKARHILHIQSETNCFLCVWCWISQLYAMMMIEWKRRIVCEKRGENGERPRWLLWRRTQNVNRKFCTRNFFSISRNTKKIFFIQKKLKTSERWKKNICIFFVCCIVFLFGI